MSRIRKQVSRVLAVGSLSEDRVLRLTRGEGYTCCHGTETEHARLAAFCEDLQSMLDAMGLELSDFTPEELQRLLEEWRVGDDNT